MRWDDRPESVHRSLRRIRKWLLDCIHRKTRQSDTAFLLRHDILGEEEPS